MSGLRDNSSGVFGCSGLFSVYGLSHLCGSWGLSRAMRLCYGQRNAQFSTLSQKPISGLICMGVQAAMLTFKGESRC